MQSIAQGPQHHFAAGAQTTVVVERRQGTDGRDDLGDEHVAVAQALEYLAQLDPRPAARPPKQPRSQRLFDIDCQIVQQIGNLAVVFC